MTLLSISHSLTRFVVICFSYSFNVHVNSCVCVCFCVYRCFIILNIYLFYVPSLMLLKGTYWTKQYQMSFYEFLFIISNFASLFIERNITMEIEIFSCCYFYYFFLIFFYVFKKDWNCFFYAFFIIVKRE